MKEQFQKGQKVEVKDYERHEWTRAIYIAYDDITGAEHKHIAKAKGPGSAEAWKYCRPRRPDLKVDAPVWVVCAFGEIQPANFARWHNDSDVMLVWAFGRNSHTARNEKEVTPFGPGRYRTTPPEEE